ncbi:hypothetical protein KY284_033276 [Solanum tuberosum]|nr:hypothetical protein KY284_033276 [Solanum tuberosum]
MFISSVEVEDCFQHCNVGNKYSKEDHKSSIAVMEIEKKSKFLNSPITLDLNDELVRSGSSKRKEGSTMKVDERKIDKRRKVKDAVSGMIGKHVVNEEQEERSEQELEVALMQLLAKY